MEQELTLPVEFPVDLTRDEIGDFQSLLMKYDGAMRMRTFSALFSGALALGGMGMAVYEWIRYREMDFITLIVSAGLLIVMLLLLFLVPAGVRRRSEQNYDDVIACGDSFTGMVRVEETAVSKTRDGGTVVFPMDMGTLFLETPDVMVFIRSGQPALFLPGRCMRPEWAQAVRRAADRLPVQNRRFSGRLQAFGYPVNPYQAPPVPVLWEADFSYTKDEFADMTREAVTTRFNRSLPVLGGLSVLGGLALGWDGDAESFWKVPVYFLLTFGVLVLLNWIIPRSRTRRMAEVINQNQLSATLRMDSRCLRVFRQGQVPFGLPWTAVEHVYDREEYVEFVGRKQHIRLPKRCIGDFDAFGRIIRDIRATVDTKSI